MSERQRTDLGELIAQAIVEGARYGIKDINQIMSMTKTELDLLILGFKLSHIDSKESDMRLAQMVAYASYKKKPRWHKDFGNPERERMALLFSEEYLDELSMNEADMNAELSRRINESNYEMNFVEE